VAYLFLVRRKSVKSLLLTSIVAFGALSAAVAADERTGIVATVDQFCSWTGLKRVSALRDIGHWKTLHDSGGNARFDLLVDGKRTQYRLIFFGGTNARRFIQSSLRTTTGTATVLALTR
jgi:hypothetical protein